MARPIRRPDGCPMRVRLSWRLEKDIVRISRWSLYYAGALAWYRDARDNDASDTEWQRFVATQIVKYAAWIREPDPSVARIFGKRIA